jgi:hypothetical protein
MATRPASRSKWRWSRSAGADLRAMLAAIKRSPIVARMTGRMWPVHEPVRAWSSVRKSPDVDAYVLAWIASHVRGPRRARRDFM